MAKKAKRPTKRTAPAVQHDNGEIILSDGTLPVVLPDGTRTKLDLTIIRLASEPVEARHNVSAGFVATAVFLIDLAAAFAPFVPGCTPTAANKLWWASMEAWQAVKKNTP